MHSRFLLSPGALGTAGRVTRVLLGILSVLVSIFAFIWLIVGAAWVYTIDLDHHICDGVLFYWVFVQITATFAFMGLGVLISLVMLIGACCADSSTSR